MSKRDQITIEPFTQDHIDFGMQLKNVARWNQLPADWSRFIDWEPEGCFLAMADDEPAGTAITIRYQDRFGWIGMVLVHPEMRRRGIGTLLLMACIDYLEHAGVAAVKLDATPMGKTLYDTIGFVDEYMIERHALAAQTCEPSPDVRDVTDADLDAICAFDAEAFGADRSRVLRRLSAEADTDALVMADGSDITGYVFLRPGMSADHIGPWCATGPEAAEALLATAISRRAGSKLFIDISRANDHSADIVARLGFERQRHLIRMFRGINASPGETDLVYGITGPEIG